MRLALHVGQTGLLLVVGASPSQAVFLLAGVLSKPGNPGAWPSGTDDPPWLKCVWTQGACQWVSVILLLLCACVCVCVSDTRTATYCSSNRLRLSESCYSISCCAVSEFVWIQGCGKSNIPGGGDWGTSQSQPLLEFFWQPKAGFYHKAGPWMMVPDNDGCHEPKQRRLIDKWSNNFYFQDFLKCTFPASPSCCWPSVLGSLSTDFTFFCNQHYAGHNLEKLNLNTWGFGKDTENFLPFSNRTTISWPGSGATRPLHLLYCTSVLLWMDDCMCMDVSHHRGSDYNRRRVWRGSLLRVSLFQRVPRLISLFVL